jgi:hypothetical protein
MAPSIFVDMRIACSRVHSTLSGYKEIGVLSRTSGIKSSICLSETDIQAWPHFKILHGVGLCQGQGFRNSPCMDIGSWVAVIPGQRTDVGLQHQGRH